MDIVKRLRKAIYHDNYGSLPADAAAEIERLQAELAAVAGVIEPHWRGAGKELASDWMVAEIVSINGSQDAEIERLQAEVQALRLELTAAYGQQQEAALRGGGDQ